MMQDDKLREHLAAEHPGIRLANMAHPDGRTFEDLDYAHYTQHERWPLNQGHVHTEGEMERAPRWQDEPDDALTNEEIYAKLREHQAAGLVKYVLTTEPLGVEWNIGIEGDDILKLNGKAQAMAFLVGANTVLAWLQRAMQDRTVGYRAFGGL